MPKPQNLKQLLIKHEGLRLKPYMDTLGKLTIGVGRNLTDAGITEVEANLLLDNDVTNATRETLRNIPSVKYLSQARQDVIISMVFNMGLSHFLQFKKMVAALNTKDYASAAREMLNSQWAHQVGNRAVELADIMVRGDYARD